MEESTSTEYTPDQAFLAAQDGMAVNGQPLRAFSTSRKFAAQAMGCACMPFSEDNAALMRSTGSYAGALKDTAIILWLCTLKDTSELTGDDVRAGVFTPEKAMRQPLEAASRALVWAEENNLTDMASGEFFEAWKLFLQIVFAVDASAFDVDVEQTGEPSLGDVGPKASPGSQNSRTPSRGSAKSPGTPQATSGKNSRTPKRSNTSKSGG